MTQKPIHWFGSFAVCWPLHCLCYALFRCAVCGDVFCYLGGCGCRDKQRRPIGSGFDLNDDVQVQNEVGTLSIEPAWVTPGLRLASCGYRREPAGLDTSGTHVRSLLPTVPIEALWIAKAELR
jgi:hypothetical protein